MSKSDEKDSPDPGTSESDADANNNSGKGTNGPDRGAIAAEFTPENMARLADCEGPEEAKDLNDREKAYHLIRQIQGSGSVFLMYVPEGEQLYCCYWEDKVWKTEGEQLLKKLGESAYRESYGKNTLRELRAQAEATLQVSRDKLGTPKRTVAVANGLLHLKDRTLEDLSPDDYALTQLPVEYDPDAEAPRWEQFVEESVEDVREQLIQEYLGYCLLVGELPFHRALLLVGEGSNGKSTFLRVVKGLLGQDNVASVSLHDLEHNRFAPAELYGKVANIDADLSAGSIGNGSTFKTVTGGDPITAEQKHKDPFPFTPTAKQLFSMNQVPDVNIDDDGFYRRTLIVEFPIKFTDPDKPGPEKDPNLTETLTDELPGILNWALEGLDRLLEQGHFTNEGDVHDKRERWQSWGDSIEKFVAECVDTDTDGKYPTAKVHDRYAAWCEEELGESPEAQQLLTKHLKGLPGVEYSDSYRFDGQQKRGLKGFALAEKAPEPGPDGLDKDRRSQQSLSQADAVEQVMVTIREIDQAEGGDVYISIPDVIKRSSIAKDRCRQIIEKLVKRGDLIRHGENAIELV